MNWSEKDHIGERRGHCTNLSLSGIASQSVVANSLAKGRSTKAGLEGRVAETSNGSHCV